MQIGILKRTAKTTQFLHKDCNGLSQSLFLCVLGDIPPRSLRLVVPVLLAVGFTKLPLQIITLRFH